MKRKLLIVNIASVMDHIVLIQFVRSSWGKESQGGQGAVLRKKTPEELLLPDLTNAIIEPSFAVHNSEYLFNEKAVEGFQNKMRFQALPANSVFTCGSILVRLIGKRAPVDYYWKDSAGMPQRHFRKDALLLEKGNWGRMLYNVRLIPSSWDWVMGGMKNGSSTSVTFLVWFRGYL